MPSRMPCVWPLCCPIQRFSPQTFRFRGPLIHHWTGELLHTVRSSLSGIKFRNKAESVFTSTLFNNYHIILVEILTNIMLLLKLLKGREQNCILAVCIECLCQRFDRSTWRRLLFLSPVSTRFFPLPFPFLARLSKPPSTKCTCRYLNLVLTENVLAVSCCSATLGIRLMACRKFLKVSRSSLICLPLVGTLTMSLKRPGSSGEEELEVTSK